MSDLAILGWGVMIGSWITSLWIMRKHREPSVSWGDRMLVSMAAKVVKNRRYAPDCHVACHQNANIAGKLFRVTVEPAETDPA